MFFFANLCRFVPICQKLSKKCPFFTQLCGLGGVFWDKTWVKSKNFGAKNHSIKNISEKLSNTNYYLEVIV